MNERSWNTNDRAHGRGHVGEDRDRGHGARRSELGGEDRADEWRSSGVSRRDVGRWENEGGASRDGARGGDEERSDRDRFGYGASRGESDQRFAPGRDAFGGDRQERGSRAYGPSERGWDASDRGGAGERFTRGGADDRSWGSSGGSSERWREDSDRRPGGSYGPGSTDAGGSQRVAWGHGGGTFGNGMSSERGADYGTQGWTSQRQGSQSYGIGGFDMGQRGAASGQGKPPKNYTRSDDRVREEVCDCLANSGHDWSDVEVQVSNGEVTLTGTVADRAHKLQAEHFADGVRGVKEVTNHLKIKRADGNASSSTGSASESAASPGEASSRARRSAS